MCHSTYATSTGAEYQVDLTPPTPASSEAVLAIAAKCGCVANVSLVLRPTTAWGSPWLPMTLNPSMRSCADHVVRSAGSIRPLTLFLSLSMSGDRTGWTTLAPSVGDAVITSSKSGRYRSRTKI